MPIVETLLRLPARVFPVQGWHAVADAVHLRRAAMAPTVRHRTPSGALLELELADFVQRSIYYDAWELPELRFTQRVLRRGDVMVDAGANIGLFALTGAQRGAEVHAFEPIPANFARLARNIGLNPGAKVHAVPVALGAEPGIASFGIPTERGSGEEMSAYFTLAGLHRQIQAPVVRLDDYLDEHGVERVRLAKVDVEGAETLVFRGALRALEQQRIDLILFEASIYTLVPHGFSLKELLSTLTDAGYVVFRLGQRRHLSRYCYKGEPDLPEREDRNPGLLRLARMGWEDRERHLNLIAVRGQHPAVRAQQGRVRVAAL